MNKERKCGNCQVCCTLLPVKALSKEGGQRCRYQTNGSGCRVYRELWHVSPECKAWSCRWLLDPEVARFSIGRPDRVHYVLDMVPDQIVGEHNETGKAEIRAQAIQVWVDPAFRDAHRDPALRRYLTYLGERYNVLAIIRYGTGDAFLLVPPNMTENGEFLERHDNTRMVKRDELYRVAAKVDQL